MGGRIQITRLIALVVGLTLAMAGTALAQTSPTLDAYGGAPAVAGETIGGGGGTQPGQVTPDVIPPPESGVEDEGGQNEPTPTLKTERGADAPAPTPTGSLPFTGFEVGLVALAGLLLLGTGLAIRRSANVRA